MSARTLLVLVMLPCAAPAVSWAQSPEDRGALEIAEWDAGPVSVAGTSIRTRVVFPSSGSGPFPVVGVIHGASRNGSYHVELARTLASRGFVAVLPDMPCSVTACDHDANASQISALLEWAVAESASSSSRISGRIDPTRRALIGHSWGGLASHLAAARDSSIDSLVLFDPNDDRSQGLAATDTISAPTLQLLAEVPGGCNGQWDEASITPRLPDPRLQMTVSGSGHCDPEEPGDAICGFACGSGDASRSTIFRRYAVAWTACTLTGDGAMAAWLGGPAMSDDESAGRIERIVESGVDGLRCRSTPALDGGSARLDAASPGPDAAVTVSDASGSLDAGTVAHDAAPPRPDAANSARAAGGCGCAALGARSGSPLFALAAALVVLRRRRAALSRRGGPT